MKRFLKDISVFFPRTRRGHAQHIRRGRHQGFCTHARCVTLGIPDGDKHQARDANRKDWANSVDLFGRVRH